MLKKYTISQMINRYIKETTLTRPEVMKNQNSHLRWWQKELGHYSLDVVRASVLVECRKKLLTEQTCRKRSRAPATVNRYFSTLGRVYSVAIKEWEWLGSSPLQNISKLEEPAGRTRFLSEAEIKTLLRVCAQLNHQDLYIAVVLALSTCARKMEIMTLRWEHINLETGVIFLYKTKNKTIRTVPLQGHALELVRARYETSGNKTGLVFPGRLSSDTPINLRKTWEEALQLAQIENFRWHDLRHTGASYLAMQGATLTELSEVLGHKTLQMVKRYAHLSLPHTIQIVAKMNQTLFQGYSVAQTNND